MCTDPETFMSREAFVGNHQNCAMEVRYWEEILSEAKEFVRTARRVYESGAPWWTKEAIRDLGKQLERIRQSGDGVYEVTVTDVLGNPKELSVRTGTSHPAYPVHWKKGERKNIPQQPRIDYVDYQKLGFIHQPLKLQESPIPHTLQVNQFEEEVDLTTGEVIPPFPLYPLDELRDVFREGKAAFEASKVCKEIIWTFENSFCFIPPVRKIIAFATCTPSWKIELDEDGRNEHDDPNVTYTKELDENANEIVASIVQLSLAIILRDFLQKRQEESGISGEIKCYAQEPRFTENDKTVLGEYGVTVLDDPHGFLEMDNETAVICFNADVPVRSITAELALPAIMVWNKCHEEPPLSPASLQNFRVSYAASDKDKKDEDSGVEGDIEERNPRAEHCILWTDPVTPRVEKMVEEEYGYADFPDGPGYYPGFGPNPAIYVRRPPPEPKSEPKMTGRRKDGPLLVNFSRPF